MDALERRAALEQERDRLARLLANLEAGRSETVNGGAAELSHVDQHPADDGSDVFESERELSLLARVRSDLAELGDALSRLRSGTYGRCEACPRVIPDERLAAVPATRFCVEHEAISEGSSSLPLPGGWRYADRGIDVDDRAGHEAAEHLEFLPADDEDVERVDHSSEELAVRVAGAEPWTTSARRGLEDALAEQADATHPSTQA
jgi:RNA polymerase-binding transcription factor DksA